MTLYAIFDEELDIARHLPKGTMGIFSDLKTLERHAWRYQNTGVKYKIAKLEIEQVYDFEEEAE